MERKKQASELLRWKRDLDAEEEKVLQLEHTALKAWEGRGGASADSARPSPARGAGATGTTTAAAVTDKRKERDAKQRQETEKKGQRERDSWVFVFQVWVKFLALGWGTYSIFPGSPQSGTFKIKHPFQIL